eukprot:ctg_1633.g517
MARAKLVTCLVISLSYPERLPGWSSASRASRSNRSRPCPIRLEYLSNARLALVGVKSAAAGATDCTQGNEPATTVVTSVRSRNARRDRAGPVASRRRRAGACFRPLRRTAQRKNIVGRLGGDVRPAERSNPSAIRRRAAGASRRALQRLVGAFSFHGRRRELTTPGGMFVPALGCHNRWGTRAINSATHACPRRFPHSSQLSRVRCMAGAFDWLRSWGERASKESAALGDALKQGRLGEYVRDKAKRDVAEVQAFQQGLMKSRERLGREIETIMERNAGKLDEMEATLRELEEALLMADLGVSVVDRVMEDLRREATEQRLRSAADIREALAASLVRILVQVEPDTGDKKAVGSTTAPAVVLLVGSNGHGKTTTAAKLAHRLRTQAQQRVLLAACDTFRAAAVDQLELWAERAGVDLRPLRRGGDGHQRPPAHQPEPDDRDAEAEAGGGATTARRNRRVSVGGRRLYRTQRHSHCEALARGHEHHRRGGDQAGRHRTGGVCGRAGVRAGHSGAVCGHRGAAGGFARLRPDRIRVRAIAGRAGHLERSIDGLVAAVARSVALASRRGCAAPPAAGAAAAVDVAIGGECACPERERRGRRCDPPRVRIGAGADAPPAARAPARTPIRCRAPCVPLPPGRVAPSRHRSRERAACDRGRAAERRPAGRRPESSQKAPRWSAAQCRAPADAPALPAALAVDAGWEMDVQARQLRIELDAVRTGWRSVSGVGAESVYGGYVVSVEKQVHLGLRWHARRCQQQPQQRVRISAHRIGGVRRFGAGMRGRRRR